VMLLILLTEKFIAQLVLMIHPVSVNQDFSLQSLQIVPNVKLVVKIVKKEQETVLNVIQKMVLFQMVLINVNVKTAISLMEINVHHVIVVVLHVLKLMNVLLVPQTDIKLEELNYVLVKMDFMLLME